MGLSTAARMTVGELTQLWAEVLSCNRSPETIDRYLTATARMALKLNGRQPGPHPLTKVMCHEFRGPVEYVAATVESGGRTRGMTMVLYRSSEGVKIVRGEIL